MLGLLATVSVLIASGIELLAQRSTLNGGLALSPTQDDIPDAAMFAYRYIPNIAAAIYSLVWNWVDLDVKRMQPWFELSKPDGSCAADSLLLEYPAEFIAFIPLKAARKRSVAPIWPQPYRLTNILGQTLVNFLVWYNRLDGVLVTHSFTKRDRRYWFSNENNFGYHRKQITNHCCS